MKDNAGKGSGGRYTKEKLTAASTGRGALVKEIILENFMSYEYARIPLQPGLNIVCGPNGSGKSSILLALSVALGQAYTERSRKLSDLIRWGKDTARVTLLFDNSPVGGRRPIPGYSSDLFRLSRYLKRDGTYWYEAEYSEVSKSEVTKLLASFGINPDNMLIIMHQNMIEEFSVISPQQKLVTVEEAVGFQSYRQRILEAHGRLTQLLSEESSISSILSNAEQTLNYWKEQYDRYLKKVELLKKKNLLENELAWAQVIKLEKALQSLAEERERKKLRLNKTVEAIRKTRKEVEELHENLGKLRFEHNESFFTLLNYEKEKSGSEIFCKLSNEMVGKLEEHLKLAEKTVDDILEGMGDDAKKSVYSSVAEALKRDNEEVRRWLLEVKTQHQDSASRIRELEGKISPLHSKLKLFEEKLSTLEEGYVDKRVREAILDFQRGQLEEELTQLNEEMDKASSSLKSQISQAQRIGARVDTHRSPQEIGEEVKIVGAHLAAAAEVSEDAEKMYKNYLEVYSELKRKSEIVSENRKKTLEEIEVRKETWRRVLRNFLNELDETYRRVLLNVDATGSIRLVAAEDIESAGLEISVGFRGTPQTVLDAYTQSGGERTTAIMAFLLSLQKHVKSPIRAVDEFDIHMDPRNRETVSKLIASTGKTQDNAQCIVITPGQLMAFDEDVNIIMVQNVGGRSEAKTVS